MGKWGTTGASLGLKMWDSQYQSPQEHRLKQEAMTRDVPPGPQT